MKYQWSISMSKDIKDNSVAFKKAYVALLLPLTLN